jgi:TM2 domain-containing membrane protein YozV
MDKSYKYLGYFFLLLIPLTIAGFHKTYIAQFPNFKDNITYFIHIHAFIATVWIGILIVQPILIVNKKFSLHRKIGKASYIVFPLLILSFIPQIIRTANSANPKNLFFSLADCSLLIIFYSLAVYYKKTSSRHMRYMIATTLVFLGPTVGRIGPILLGWSEMMTQNVQYGIIYLILVSLLFYDKANNKKFQPYSIAICFFVVHQIVYHVVFL